MNRPEYTNQLRSIDPTTASEVKAFQSAGSIGFRAAAITLAAGALITLGSLLPAQAQTTHKATAKHHARHHAAQPKLVAIKEINSSWSHPYAQQTSGYWNSYADNSASTPARSMTSRASGTTSNFIGSADLPSSATPIMNRIAALLQASQARATSHLPTGAHAPYAAAATSFRQALMAGRMSARGTAPANGTIVSSLQVTDDIQTLRLAAQQTSGRQSAALTQIASLYATGAKDFFTGELRLALFGNGGSRGVAIAINGNNSSSERRMGSVSSSELPKAPGYPNEGHGGGGGIIQPDGTVGPDTTPAVPGPPSPTAPVGDIPPVVTAPIVPVLGDGGVVTSPVVTTPVVNTPVVPAGNPALPVAPATPPVAPTVP